jgi:ADP-heptose:LPS heptosyltransferase
MGMLIKKEKIETKKLSLKDFYKKRNKILLWHDKGGLGDVLMQRMMFRDFKNIIPDAELIFACLPEYMDAAKDHPCISKVIDSRTVNLEDYSITYNTCVSIADRYENINAPFCDQHRSDIWAKYCGIELQNHEMDFVLCEKEIKKARKNLEFLTEKKGPLVLFAPVSKMAVKSLLDWQIKEVIACVNEIKPDSEIIGIHNKNIPGIKGVYNASIEEWMYYIAAADYVISVDTATFHMAGGLKKPLVGIFTFADGKAYGKHFDFVLVQKHRDNGNWECGPCFKFASCPKCNKALKPCLTELSKEELRQGIFEMFEKWAFIK